MNTPRLARAARATALAGYFGLFGLLMAWLTWLAPSHRFPVALTLLVMVSPLLLPLRGLLHARPYTHAWTAFLALPYFAHGVVETYANPAERPFGALEVLFSLLLFVGCIGYARYAGTGEKV